MSVLDIGAEVSALSPIATDVYGLLTEATAIAGGRVYDAVPADPAYPFVLIGVDEQPLDSYGTAAGVFAGDITIHVFSIARGMAEAQSIMADIVARLRISGRYGHDETRGFPDELVRGKVARELIGRFRVFAGVSA